MTRFDAPTDFPRDYINPIAVGTPGVIRWIEALRPRAIGSWDELGRDEYGRAFVAAQTAGSDIIADLYQGLVATAQAEEGQSDYVDRVLPVLRAKGWLPDLGERQLAARVALIYDTQISIALATGNWRNIQANKAVMPYIQYRATGDDRTRPGHMALDRVTLPVEHPLWRRYFPPCGFRCRCRAVSLQRSTVAIRGGVTSDAELDDRLAIIRSRPQDFWPYSVSVGAENAEREMEQAVAAANDRRMDGAPPVTAVAGAALGATIWAGIFANLSERLIAAINE